MRVGKVKKIIGLLLISIMVLSLNVFAATTGSFSTSISSKELNKDESVTVSITTVNCAGKFTITSSDSSVASANKSSIWVEGTEEITITAKSAGTAKIYVIASNVADNQTPSEDVEGTRTITIKVTEPVTEPEPPTEPETPSEPETPVEPETPTEPETPVEPETPTEPETPIEPETPTVTEPTFTNLNKTMYTTKECNLRDSWSLESTPTGVKEKTELTVTGISTDKVGDYVWYRVSYNGDTKYVASFLLTDIKPEEDKKSDNAYLKSLTIEGQELTPSFNKETTEYTMQVKNDVTELNIKAEAEDEKATISVQGNKDLKVGENTVTVSVNAEDNTIKIYEIKVTRLEENPLGLESLKIKDTDIEYTFKTDIYDYEIDIKEDVTKLEIEAIANDETATVEILGNEDLQEGENLITIIVSSEDGEEKVTYQIKANKAKEKVAVVDEKQETDPKIYGYIAIGAILLVALIIVIIYTIKNRNTELYAYNYDEEEEDYQELPEELPERKEPKKENNNFSDEESDNKKGKHF